MGELFCGGTKLGNTGRIIVEFKDGGIAGMMKSRKAHNRTVPFEKKWMEKYCPGVETDWGLKNYQKGNVYALHKNQCVDHPYKNSSGEPYSYWAPGDIFKVTCTTARGTRANKKKFKALFGDNQDLSSVSIDEIEQMVRNSPKGKMKGWDNDRHARIAAEAVYEALGPNRKSEMMLNPDIVEKKGITDSWPVRSHDIANYESNKWLGPVVNPVSAKYGGVANLDGSIHSPRMLLTGTEGYVLYVFNMYCIVVYLICNVLIGWENI